MCAFGKFLNSDSMSAPPVSHLEAVFRRCARWTVSVVRFCGGVRRGDAPSGVVTFLFTDVEGSTRRWEADADAMRAALMAHDEVLRTAIEAHEGIVFSHTGDGVVAAFASPRSAVDAAVAAQQALELPVRMGIATGEAELRDGDYSARCSTALRG